VSLLSKEELHVKGTGEPKALWRKNFPRLFGEPGAARYRPRCALLVVFVRPSYRSRDRHFGPQGAKT
jgi:hypothetical protein